MKFKLLFNTFLFTSLLPMCYMNTSNNISNTTDPLILPTRGIPLTSRLGKTSTPSDGRRQEKPTLTSPEQSQNKHQHLPPTQLRRQLQEQLMETKATMTLNEFENKDWMPRPDNEEDTTTTPTSIYYFDSNEMPDPEEGPTRGKTYNPNRGYEMYWVDGHWVFRSVAPNYPENTCGRFCPPMYKEYGEICGRNKFFRYRTFDDYCEMLADDCTGYKDWTIAHTGECNPYWKTNNWTQLIDRPPREGSLEGAIYPWDIDYVGQGYK